MLVRYLMPLRVLAILLPALLLTAAGCRAWGGPPYDFDVVVKPAGKVTEIAGDLRIELEVLPRGADVILKPRLSVSLETRHCPSTRLEALRRLPSHGKTWGGAFEAACGDLRSDVRTAGESGGWRLTFAGPHRPASLDRAKIWIGQAPQGKPAQSLALQGGFTAEKFVFEIPGYRVVNARWSRDDLQPKIAKFLLEVELAPAAPGPAAPGPAEPEPAVPPAGLPPATPAETPRAPAAPAGEPAGASLRSLELRAVAEGSGPAGKWPPLEVFLRPAGESAWQGSFGLKPQDLAKPQRLELPAGLAGRDLWVQVQAGSLTLPLSEDGATFRARVAGRGAADAVLPVRPAPVPLFYGGQVLGPEGGAATVTLTWASGQQAVVRTDKAGLWRQVAPDPPSRLDRWKIEAVCFVTSDRPAAGGLPSPTVKLESACKNTFLEVHLRPAGAGPAIARKDWEAATIEVRQDGRPSETFAGFDENGEKSVEVLIDPRGGPLEVEAKGHHFAGAARVANPLAGKAGEYFTRVDVAVRGRGRGVAFLLNGAENWPHYARVQQALSEALAASGAGDDPPARLLLGTLEGERRLIDPADFRKPERLREILAWLGGMAPTAVRLRFAQLERRLAPLTEMWPAAASWDLALLVPFDPENDEPGGEEVAARAAAELKRAGVQVHVAEVGGASRAMKALAGDRHLQVDLAAAEKTGLQQLGAFLRRLLGSGPGEEPRDGR